MRRVGPNGRKGLSSVSEVSCTPGLVVPTHEGLASHSWRVAVSL